MSLLTFSWISLTLAIALLQLLALSQPEWVVHSHNIQGLFAICGDGGCVLRPSGSLIPMFLHLVGSLLMLTSALFLLPTICLSKSPTPIQWIANMQIIAALLMAACLFLVPFDMEEIDCTVTMLLRSSFCRVGWALSLSAICCMLSICCPILGKLAADQRKQYSLLSSEHFI